MIKINKWMLSGSVTSLVILIVQPVLADEVTGKKASELPDASHSASPLLKPSKSINTYLSSFCNHYPQHGTCLNLAITEEPTQTAQFSNNNNDNEDLSGWAITPEVSTLGLGGSLTAKISPKLNARLGVNAFSVGLDIEATEVNYDSDLNLFNVSAVADYYPNDSGFKFSGGVIINDNKIDGPITAQTGQDVTIGNQTFTIGDDLDSAEATADFPSLAPYVGIGWGNPVSDSRWTFNVNVGAMFVGSPDINITPQNVDPASENALNQAIAQEEQDLEDNSNEIIPNVYPVATLGVSYQF